MIIGALGEMVDERYTLHRLKASSLAAIVGAGVASALFAYRYFAADDLRWDLLAVALSMAIVKIAGMLWYRATD